MSFKCLIVDDEELARELIARHVSQLSGFEVVAECANAIEATSILENKKVDLMFLDIEMPILKGTEFYKSLTNKPKVIFTTAHRNYALDGFDLNAVDYLLKPVTFARFFKAIQKFKESKAVDVNTPKEIDHVYVSKDRKKVKVVLSSILYIESVKDYITIFTGESDITIKCRISSFMSQLDDRFLRIHRSYIVNKNEVSAFTKNDIEIGKVELPIGETYRVSVSEGLGEL